MGGHRGILPSIAGGGKGGRAQRTTNVRRILLGKRRARPFWMWAGSMVYWQPSRARFPEAGPRDAPISTRGVMEIREGANEHGGRRAKAGEDSRSAEWRKRQVDTPDPGAGHSGCWGSAPKRVWNRAAYGNADGGSGRGDSYAKGANSYPVTRHRYTGADQHAASYSNPGPDVHAVAHTSDRHADGDDHARAK
jgi:hypothetical protein